MSALSSRRRMGWAGAAAAVAAVAVGVLGVAVLRGDRDGAAAEEDGDAVRRLVADPVGRGVLRPAAVVRGELRGSAGPVAVVAVSADADAGTDAEIRAVAVATGELRWTRPGDHRVVGALLDGSGLAFEDRVVDAATGAVRWTTPEGEALRAVTDDGIVSVAAGDGSIVVRDPAAGAERRRFPAPCTAAEVTSVRRAVVVRCGDGASTFHVYAPGGSSPVVAVDATEVVDAGAGRLLALTGDASLVDVATGGTRPLDLGPAGTALLEVGDRLVALDPFDGTARVLDPAAAAFGAPVRLAEAGQLLEYGVIDDVIVAFAQEGLRPIDAAGAPRMGLLAWDPLTGEQRERAVAGPELPLDAPYSIGRPETLAAGYGIAASYGDGPVFTVLWSFAGR